VRLLVAARNRTVAVEDGRIIEQEGHFDLELNLPDADVRPGLINAHDHLHRNHYGRLGAPIYGNGYQWAHDIQARDRDHIAERHAIPRREALLIGAWKNLFAGVTSVVHHDRWEPDFNEDFPISVVPIASADSLGMTPAAVKAPTNTPFCLHLAEGVDDVAGNEVHRLHSMGLLSPFLIAVHGVGITGEGISLFRSSGAALTWCPTSNAFLFGCSVDPTLIRQGVDVLLGTDSLLTGTGNLLDELRYARSLRYLSNERLEDAVSVTAARRLGLPQPSLDPGSPADLVFLRRPILEASPGDVALVIAKGIPRVADLILADPLNRLTPNGALMHVGPITRWTNGHAGRAAKGRPL
jgi:cytosine/adenosine deaminase-related metal-dependent hydrolase